MHGNGTRWLAMARRGYCAKTSDVRDEMRAAPKCTTPGATKGVLEGFESQNWRSWSAASAQCQQLCRACAACQFISLSLQHKDCSWYSDCNLDKLEVDVPGFRSGAVKAQVARKRPPSASLEQSWWTPNEIGSRWRDLVTYADRQDYNLSGVARLLAHPRLQLNLWRGVRVSAAGRRWDRARFQTHADAVYLRHHRNQSAAERAALRQRWSSTLVGRVRVLDLLLLLHFTIDHTDTYLTYTSQLIHCLQVHPPRRTAAAAACPPLPPFPHPVTTIPLLTTPP